MQAFRETADEISPARRFAITAVVMAASLMQVLDTTIANVALPHMQASLGATQDSIAWVLTSYIVASAIATPVTGWLEGRLGRRCLFAISVGGFTLASIGCGLAPSLEFMVVARLFQGVFGGFIAPLSQAVMLDVYPSDKRALAMTIWGMGVMIGPILGPIAGGVLTDHFDWRWVFFINIPFGVLAVMAGWVLLKPARTADRPFDLAGFAMLGCSLAAFQLLLDRGTQVDWFEATEIWIEAGVAVGGLWMFAVHVAMARHPLISLGAFRDRNLVIASIFTLVTTGIMMASAVLLTPMMQRLMGYGVIDAGALVMPRGIAMMVAMIIAGRLAAIVDSRVLISMGLLMAGCAQWMMTGFDLEMGSHPIIITGLLYGFGYGFIALPLNLLAFGTLPAHLRTEGAAVYALSRNLGGAIAISVTTALLARSVQISHSDLASHVTAVKMGGLDWGVLQALGYSGEGVAIMLDGEVNRQALMIGYINDYWLMTIAAFLLLPLVLLLRRPKPGAEAAPIGE